MCLDHTYREYKKVRKYLPSYLVAPRVYKPKKGSGKKYDRNTFRRENTKELNEE